MEKRIVAIIVTYNRCELLLEALDALKNCIGNCDIFVIDNASTDGTKDKVTPYIDQKMIFYFNTGRNLGGAGGFNFGVRKAYEAGYDYIWLMDDDTIVKKDTLTELLEQAKALKGNFGWLSSLALWIDGNECLMNYQEIDKDWNSEKKNILNGRLRCQAATFVSLFVNRVAVEEVGLPIKEYFIWGDDTEYTKRISKKYSCYFVPSSQVTHKMKSNMVTTSFEEFSDKDRIDRMFYSIRNDLCTYSRISKRHYYVMILDFLLLIGKVLRSNQPYKGRKIKVIVEAVWCGLWFRPPIELVK